MTTLSCEQLLKKHVSGAGACPWPPSSFAGQSISASCVHSICSDWCVFRASRKFVRVGSKSRTPKEFFRLPVERLGVCAVALSLRASSEGMMSSKRNETARNNVSASRLFCNQQVDVTIRLNYIRVYLTESQVFFMLQFFCKYM